jgi:hypothetical protein
VEKQTPNLTPLTAAVKRQGSNGNGMLRPFGHAACVRAARKEARKTVAAMHADDPAFYSHGITRPARPARLVKKG